jgi:anti-sigma B factor antagonist
MQVHVERLVRGEYGVATVRGEVDLAGVHALREALHHLIDSGSRHLVLDLDQVTFMDSTGLGVLIGACRRAQSCDGSLSVVGASPRLLKIFKLTGLTGVFRFVERLDDVIPAAGPSASA